jgi:hypothetical protein
VLVVSRPVFGLWVWLVFWFGLFFDCCWDGWRGFLACALCWLYVVWAGMGMGGYVGLMFVDWTVHGSSCLE